MKPAAPTLLDATGRVAFVTGATGGIGQSVVRMMLEAGAKVAATGRRAVPFNHDHVLPLTLDVTDEDAIARAIQDCMDRFGRIDYLIHMAGMVGKGRLDTMSLDDWNKVITTNLTSSFLLLKHAYTNLTKPGGVAVLCGSSNGYNGGSHLSGAAYASSKAALVNLTRYCAKEWAPDGLRLHVLSPGPVDTPMLERLSDEEHENLKDILPLGHYATPDECAGAVLFLCSSHAKSMTGTNTNISSGLVLDA
ncbi:MAG: SDR family NAD(P)-dependent oxidoreductase [Rhodospirillaceae bacterium]